MSNQYDDPSGNTTQFQAFVTRPEPQKRKTPVGPVIGATVLAVVVLALLGWVYLA